MEQRTLEGGQTNVLSFELKRPFHRCVIFDIFRWLFFSRFLSSFCLLNIPRLLVAFGDQDREFPYLFASRLWLGWHATELDGTCTWRPTKWAWVGRSIQLRKLRVRRLCSWLDLCYSIRRFRVQSKAWWRLNFGRPSPSHRPWTGTSSRWSSLSTFYRGTVMFSYDVGTKSLKFH